MEADSKVAIVEAESGPTLDQIAYDIWMRRGRMPSTGHSEWEEAQRHVVTLQRHRVEITAHDLWLRRGKGAGDPLLNWRDAEQIVIWQEWSRAKLKPYLAIGAIRQPKALDRMHTVQNNNNSLSDSVVSVIAVLDGSPEYSRHCLQTSQFNCVLPEQTVEIRDAEFQRHVIAVFQRYKVHFVDRHNAENGCSVHGRRYQDGCLAEFPGPSPRFALQASLYLRRQLLEINELENRPWDARIHPRIVIGGSFNDAAKCLQSTTRDQITVTPTITRRITPGEQDLLNVDNIRFESW